MERAAYYRPTKAIVHLAAVKKNVTSLKRYLRKDTSIIAVVKANGYGHGDIEIADAALEAGATMVAVATPEEAVRLREHGITSDILVMAPTPISFLPVAAKLAITVTAAEPQWMKEAFQIQEQFVQPLKIHVKVDSGMGRIGLRDTQALHEMIDLFVGSRHLVLDGIFTHFACADDACPKATEQQAKLFKRFIEELPEKPRLVHASNSAATLLYPEYEFDAVRFGIALYGISPSPHVEARLPFELHRALTIESELTHVKRLPKGQNVSYGASYTTTADEWIGTIPIGYADGLRRGLKGQEVLIAGERAPIVGTICMDQCMVKLSSELKTGEKVVLIGMQGDEEIKVEEWATRLQTIPYEMIVSISSRVPRIYQT